MKSRRGFTIVELLIVIVIIGVLAALVIVAYNGIQDRANQTAVAADLNMFHKKVSLYNADNSHYPSNATELTNGIRVPFNKSLYYSNDGNLMYCASSGGADYMLIVRHTASKRYYISSTTGGSMKDYVGSSGTPVTMCGSIGFTATQGAWGYEPTMTGWGNPGWRAWTGS